MAKVALLGLLLFCFLKATSTFQWDYSTDSLRDGISAAEIKVLLGMKSIEAMHRYIVFWRSLSYMQDYQKLWTVQ
ncbi:hypothetical protein ACQVUB_27585 [Bacillus mycoides]|uniref:hypothetical protein n=1 Tax=Bacillus mycoides TaxID=1405 RepID=UPI003D64C5D6